MQATSGQVSVPVLQALLSDGSLAGAWVLDPAKSSIRLKTRTLGLVPVHGIFSDVTGAGTVFPDGRISGTVTVATASIDTRNARRDAHLRSADFFDSERTPDITFTAEGIRLTDQRVAVTGALTVRDCTRPLSFDAVTTVRGDGEIWLDTEVHIDRADFGLTWNQLGLLSMKNRLAIHIVFIRG
jgi:polyisoprenoid-binding protein YceI